MEEISLAAFKVNCGRKALDCFFKFAHSVQTDAFIIIGECILGFDFDRIAVVSNGLLKLTELVMSETAVKKRLEMIRENFKSLSVILHRKLVIALLARLVSFSVILLRLLLDRGILLQHLSHFLTNLRRIEFLRARGTPLFINR